MTAVMWGEADALCRARGARTRLPTEQEWEAAARGTDARIYPWGNSWQADHANAGGGQRVAAVGRYPTGRSPVGAEDMIGNVWEWTSTEAERHVDGRRQYVFRGGAFDTDSINATALHRPAQPEAAPERDRMTYYAKTGFRCVQSLR